MTMEKLVQAILDKSDNENVDLLIAKIMVRKDLEVAGELNGAVDTMLDNALVFITNFMRYPKTAAIFGQEYFNTGKTCEDYLVLIEEERKDR